MSTSARELPVEELQPGMKTAAEVLDARGNVLLPAGAVLSQAVIGSLARHGFAHVSIAVEEDAPVVDAAQCARLAARLDHLFRATATATANAELLALLRHHRGVD